MNDKPIIIFGNTGYAIRVMSAMQSDGYNIQCFTADSKYIKEKSIQGKPVIPFEDIEKIYSPDKYDMLNCSGYSKMNKVYELVFHRILDKGYTIINYISKKADFKGKMLGVGNIVLEHAYIGNNVVVGNGNRFGFGLTLCHDINIGNYNYLAAETTVAGNVDICNNCFLGVNCTISNRVTIADYTLVGAGALITKSTNEYEVWAPARAVKLEKISTDFF